MVLKKIMPLIFLLILMSCIHGKKNIEESNEQAEIDETVSNISEINVIENNERADFYEAFFNNAKIAAMENEEFKNITFIPYIESGSWGDGSSWRELGYINSETFEIMIPAQYRYAGPFRYGYAAVQKNIVSRRAYDGAWIYRDRNRYKYSIINKKGTEILEGFDNVRLLDTEYGEFILAATEKYLEVDTERHLHLPITTNYQLYNLTTGNILIEEDIRPGSYKNRPEIMFYSHYMTYDDVIYEIKDDGTLEKTEIDIETLVSIIIKERNLTYKENNFHYYNERRYIYELGIYSNSDPYLGYFDTLDYNLLLHNIPENMYIIEIEPLDKQLYDDNKPVYSIRPINRDAIRPFKKNKLLYELRLANNKNESYIGLYDAEENKWAILPIKIETSKGDSDYIGFFSFGITGYKDWVGYTYFVYFPGDEYLDNSKSYYTSNIYNIVEGKIYPFRMEDTFMVYFGYHE